MDGTHDWPQAEGMIHLHDVDILIKLAACGLLDDLPALLASEDLELTVLNTAVYKIRGLGKQKKLQQAVVDLAIDFCERHPDLPDLRDEQAFARLATVGEPMDPGEAVLFSVALAHHGSFVVSGDKRALIWLGNLPGKDPIRKGLQGTVICFEELLLRYFTSQGYDRLRTRCCAGMDTDGMLKLAFSGGLATPEAHAMEGIRFYWRSLNKNAGGLLVGREDAAEFSP